MMMNNINIVLSISKQKDFAQQTRCIETMLFSRWPNVLDAGPIITTLVQCLMGAYYLYMVKHGI